MQTICSGMCLMVKTTEKADTTKAGTVTSAIGSLAYDKFVDYNCTDDSKYGFDDPYAVITVKYTEEEQENTRR